MQLSSSLKSMCDENETCQNLQDTEMSKKSFVEVVALRKAIFDGCKDKI